MYTLLLLACLSAPALAGNLARDAAYSVTVSGFVYAGQIIPGTNTPAAANGFADAPPWQGDADTLTDGQADGKAVATWFWSQMDKRITVRFDLRRSASITTIRVVGKLDEGFQAARARVATTEAGLAEAAEVALQLREGGVSWTGEALQGRWVEVRVQSAAPAFSITEVEIEGEAAGDPAADAPPPGLRPVAQRDLAPLVALPAKGPGVVNAAAAAGAALAVTSRHYDDKTGACAADTCASDSDPTGRALVDGDRKTAARSFSGWYCAKTLTAELVLGRPWQVERVVVWPAGHGGPQRSYLNAFRVWLQAGDGAAWTPADEVRNPVLPDERPPAQYPVASPVIAKPATRVRIQLEGMAQSADVVEVGEFEVWGRPLEGEVAARPLRVKAAVPEVQPEPLAQTLSPACDWITKDRVRALYGYVGQWKDRGLLDSVQQAGFNAFIVHTMGQTHKPGGWEPEVAEWLKVQDERKLRIIISWPFGSDERYGNTQFGAYQPGGGQVWTRTPCPLAKEYWDRVVGDRAEVAAKAGLTGMVVDMEMYGADSTRYSGPCFCDTCWGRFVAEHLEGVAAGDVPLAERPAWVAGNGLAPDYSRWQELEVEAILNGIEQRVHAVNPDFLLGNLLDPESLPGLARGFGTPTMPALVFSELEYPGTVTGTAARVKQLREGGYPAIYVPGLWIRPVTPDQLPGLVAKAGPGSGGFWIWSSAAFSAAAGSDYAHAAEFSHDDYWQGFAAANAALTAALKDRAPAAEAAAHGPEATVPRVAGALTEADWAGAAVLGPFRDHTTGAPEKARTEARALWDGERLHLRVSCEEPAPEKSPALHGGRDDATLWQQDSVEVFWQRPGSDTYAHLVVNAAGAFSDAIAVVPRAEDPTWNADVQVAATRGEGRWELRLAIPLQADGLGELAGGAEVLLEVARNRPGGGETTCWAPTGGMFKGATELWGSVRLQ